MVLGVTQTDEIGVVQFDDIRRDSCQIVTTSNEADNRTLPGLISCRLGASAGTVRDILRPPACRLQFN